MRPSAIESMLEEDHAQLDDQIVQLCATLEERDVGRSFHLLDLTWARLAVHIRAEHLCLFPALLNAARQLSASENGIPRFDEAQGVIDQLKHDHDFFMVELARAVNMMRGMMSSKEPHTADEQLRDVQKTISAVKARLEEHNKLEEEQVYHWPAALLDSPEQARLVECVRCELKNMPPRFAKSAQAEQLSDY